MTKNITLLFIISFIVSHIIITISSLIFFDQLNLAIPFLFVKDYTMPSIKLLFYKEITTPSFAYSGVYFYVYLLLILLPPLAIYNSNKKEKYGYAKFIHNRKEILNMGLNFNNGIIFGRLKNNGIKRLFTGNKYDTLHTNEPLSTLIVAPTGTGKSAGFIIPTLLKGVRGSTVIFDIKGELYNKTHHTQENPLFLDPTMQEETIKFNPFAENQLPTENITGYISNASNIIFPTSENYFVNSAKDLFDLIALYLINKNGWTSIPRIKNLISEDEDITQNLKTIKEELTDDDKTTTRIRNGINKMLQISEAPEQFRGVIGSFNTQMSFFADEDIEYLLDCQYSDINAEMLRKKKTSLYIRVKDNDMERLSPFVRLFFHSLVSDIISKAPEEEDLQISLILDEFGNLGKISKLIKATTISRSYKLNQIFILQDLEQISFIYSKSEVSILESNTSYKIILKQNNLMTAQRFSDLIGNKTDIRTSKSEGQKHTSKSSSEEGIKLVSPQDILNLHNNQCLVMVQGNFAKVIKADICWYFKDFEYGK
jgi:type IV secretion system protein VirD4